MTPYRIYQQQQMRHTTRIDLLLSLYDKTIGHLTQAQCALKQEDNAAATAALLQAQLHVYALASGVDPQYRDIARPMLQLYEFVLRRLSVAETQNINDALRVLTMLREGWLEIEGTAKKLEWSGQIPPLPAVPALRLSV